MDEMDKCKLQKDHNKLVSWKMEDGRWSLMSPNVRLCIQAIIISSATK